jgi:hypothetical protein
LPSDFDDDSGFDERISFNDDRYDAERFSELND